MNDSIDIGDLHLPNRIIMAPLTRCRASKGRVPNDMMAEYYRQRAGAGMIISEATSVTPMGVGYPDTPGIWSEDQVNGWRKAKRMPSRLADSISLIRIWRNGSRLTRP